MGTTVTAKPTESDFSFTDTSLSIPRSYIVETTSDLTEIQVKNLTDMPKLGDTLSGTSAIVTSVAGQARKTNDNKYIWDVLVTYTQAVTTSVSYAGGSNRLVDYSIGYRSYNIVPEEFFTNNTLGGSIENTAGMPFDNPPTIEVYNAVIKWTQKEQSWFNPNNGIQYMNTVNSGGVTVVGASIPAHCGLLRGISPILKRDSGGGVSFETTYEVEYNLKGFGLRIRNNGFKYLDAGGKLTDILKGDVNPSLKTGTAAQRLEASEKVNQPADLDEFGHVITVKGAQIYKTFYPIMESNWGSLDLLRSINA